MDLILNIDIKGPGKKISYRDKILLVGSCFTEHIGNSLSRLKFTTLQNPNGILFDPISVADSLESYVSGKKYTKEDLFQLNEVWQSWKHHSRFTDVDCDATISLINDSQSRAHEFIRSAKWVIITLGSSFSYKLNDEGASSSGANTAVSVANCHRAPAQWFTKTLTSVEETTGLLQQAQDAVLKVHSETNFIYTISPVRHVRDGVVENNRSKARLIEAVHALVNRNHNCHYFPAYEIVIDVLRDYRFYDIDLVHPNYAATEYVFEKFVSAFIDEESKILIKDMKRIATAKRHRPMQPGTDAHKKFLNTHFDLAKKISEQHPYLDLSDELKYFGS